MDPSPHGNFTTFKGGASSGTDDHSYTRPVRNGHAHSGDNNLHLVHLLSTNPAAALPAIFPTRGGAQKVFPRRTFQLNRSRMPSANNSYRGSYSEQIAENSWTANILNERALFKRQRSFSELYASKEEIDQKGRCIDKEGNFDFDALLPVVYWRPELHKDFPRFDNS